MFINNGGDFAPRLFPGLGLVRSVAAGDTDGDGDTDIVSGSYYDDTIAWYENDGASDPSFVAFDITTTATGAFKVCAADLDGDGDTDIVSALFGSDTVAWYEQD